jgi:acyl carrier protein
MENIEKYKKAFVNSFEVKEEDVDKLEYQSIPEWDSVGHMGLISELEEAFNIQFEMDDVVELGSYFKGIEILKKYQIEILNN